MGGGGGGGSPPGRDHIYIYVMSNGPWSILSQPSLRCSRTGQLGEYCGTWSVGELNGQATAY